MGLRKSTKDIDGFIGIINAALAAILTYAAIGIFIYFQAKG